MSKKRIAIYTFYDKSGIVDRYVTYMLQEILTVCEKLVVVCNGKLSDDGRKAFNALTKDLITRENEGFDAWGFKAGLDHIGRENLKEYDELVLVNDSVFGPIYPFKQIIKEMDGKSLDFWGITKHEQSVDFYGLTKSGVFFEHIQSYFFVINKNMFMHTGFNEYWDKLPKLNSWEEAISYYETTFTKYFENMGFIWDVYVNTVKMSGKYSGMSKLLLMPYELIYDYKCPVLKRKSFTFDDDSYYKYADGRSTAKALDFVKDNTDYDIDMIIEHVFRTINLDCSIKNEEKYSYIKSALYNSVMQTKGKITRHRLILKLQQYPRIYRFVLMLHRRFRR
ncbi:MAG: rhamnan synthesis F family protein [Oscillospiraceae bacterium]|jgi:rhamnosyltransferase|nr:rhamnan synthesis F family protein [Oscillospiraceae bacterium]